MTTMELLIGETVAKQALLEEGVELFDDQQNLRSPDDIPQLTPSAVAQVVLSIAKTAEVASATAVERAVVIADGLQQAHELTENDAAFDERAFKRGLVIALMHNLHTGRRLRSRKSLLSHL